MYDKYKKKNKLRFYTHEEWKITDRRKITDGLSLSANVQVAKARMCFSDLYVRKWTSKITDGLSSYAILMTIFVIYVFFCYFQQSN